MSTIFPSSTEINKISRWVGQKWRAYIFVDHALIGNHSKYFNIYIALRDIGLLTTCKPHLKIMDHKRIFRFIQQEQQQCIYLNTKYLAI